MAEWIVCPTCNLKHAVRADRLCPRCREAIDRSSGFASPPPIPPTPPARSTSENAERPAAAATPTPPPPPRAAATPPPFGATRCESCGKIGPVGRVEFHQNIGALIVRFHKSVKGNVCPECAKKHFQELTLTTLVGGWWGVISFVMTPFILVNNVLQYLSYKPTGQPNGPMAHGASSGFAPSAASPPANLRKGLAIASLVLGIVGLLTFGLFGVGAILGLTLGGIAIWKATKQPAEYGGRGMAVAGVVANAAGGAMALILSMLIWAGHSMPHPPPAPGQTAFQAASSKIFMFNGETAFGNTPDAKSLAERHSRVMTSMSEILFTGGPSKRAPSLSEGKFLTYCERRPDRICFLVHVPALRSYQGEARTALLKIAWMAAKQVTKEARTPADLKIAVGLRGAVAYGATATGMGEGQPLNQVADVLDEAPLYEFFLEPAAVVSSESASVVPR
jgi:hypothetical protein